MGGITLGAHVGIQESCEPLKLARTTRSVFQTGSLYTSDEKEEVKLDERNHLGELRVEGRASRVVRVAEEGRRERTRELKVAEGSKR